MKRILLFFGLIVILPSFLSANPQQPLIKEKLVPLGNILADETFYPYSLRVSPDFKHIAYVSSIRELFWVWKDGVSGKSCAGITRQSPFFSPQKNRLAYIAQEGDQMFVVIDDQEHDRYKQIGTITFSPDGSRLAYRAEDEKGRQMVVLDGKPGPTFEVGISNKIGIVFSPDSQHLAYVGITKNDSCIFVKDNKKKYSCKKIEEIKFSPDSKHVAFTAMDKDKWAVVLDDKKGSEYDLVNGLMFSPDSNQLVYLAQKNRRQIIVKKNKEISGGIAALNPIFSSDGKRFACLLIEKINSFRYVIDEKPELSVEKPGNLIFSHDGTSTAYIGLIDKNWHMIKNGVKGPAFKNIYAFAFSPATSDIMYAADDEDGKACIVLNDVKGKPYDSIGTPVFSPDGKKYGYVARQNTKEMFMVINGEEHKPYPIIGIPMEDKSGKSGIAAQRPFFSLDGHRLAYPVFDPDNDKAFMVVDGKAHPAFDVVTIPSFSSDGKNIVYLGQKGKEWRLVVNGQASAKTCGGMIEDAAIAFDSPNHCYVLVANRSSLGISFFRLEAEITGSEI